MYIKKLKRETLSMFQLKNCTDNESNRPDIVLKEVDNFFEQVLIYFFTQCAVSAYQSVRGRRYDSELRNQQGWKDSNTLENLLF